ncbi:MAG: LPS assembly lipoprotein LptE [Yoonia sp.]|uniref:LPS assembly lipoprotein LptE n=1 Tax=Yoonia sp. TaxID=2212373 RepID=UPI00273D471B|nr:LPS assembly lipoprotein LptE [Yoonia sp.]MDP5086361.1 LPS assembly lipoprotein LptE [Yoonia sp.]
MSSDRIPRRILLAGLLALSGCGFVPVYSDGAALRGQISFTANDTVAGFRLRERLETRLGQSTAPRYQLSARVSQSQRTAAITSDGANTRFNIIGRATWALTENATGSRIGAGEVEAFTSYSATSSTVATQSTKDDAEARLAVILADMIVSRILVLTPEPAS